jgi:hypothetical protein
VAGRRWRELPVAGVGEKDECAVERHKGETLSAKATCPIHKQKVSLLTISVIVLTNDVPVKTGKGERQQRFTRQSHLLEIPRKE